MKKVTITGANGYLGRLLIDAFLNASWSVVAATRNECRNEGQVGGGCYSNVIWRLGDSPTLEMLSSDLLIHLACDCIKNPSATSENYSIDVIGTQILYEAWISEDRRCTRTFVFMSSMSVPLRFNNQYAHIKSLCENLFDERCVLILRPGIIYNKNAVNGLYGMIKKLLSFPVLPVIRTRKIFYCVEFDVIFDEILLYEDYHQPIARINHQGPFSFGELIPFVAKIEQQSCPLIINFPKIFLVITLNFIKLLGVRFYYLRERLSVLL
jgi:nucleoside-diphosphate-sugar epimerase